MEQEKPATLCRHDTFATVVSSLKICKRPCCQCQV
jgi:hypothetical protein